MFVGMRDKSLSHQTVYLVYRLGFTRTPDKTGNLIRKDYFYLAALQFVKFLVCKKHQNLEIDYYHHHFTGQLRHHLSRSTLSNKILSCFNRLEYLDYANEIDHMLFWDISVPSFSKIKPYTILWIHFLDFIKVWIFPFSKFIRSLIIWFLLADCQLTWASPQNGLASQRTLQKVSCMLKLQLLVTQRGQAETIYTSMPYRQSTHFLNFSEQYPNFITNGLNINMFRDNQEEKLIKYLKICMIRKL